MNLQQSVKDTGRALKMYAGRLQKLNIETLEDFLYHIPFRYEDFSLISPIDKVQPGETVTIQGEVVQIRNVFTRNHKKLQEGKVQDKTGIMDILWFNQLYLTKMIHMGDSISLSGRVEENKGKLVMISPEYEILYPNSTQTLHTGRLVPVYPETKGVSSKWLRRQTYKIIYEFVKNMHEYMPYSILDKEKSS
ncbi:MAG TPA: OB-fold nucleic acid binding domain-containing protein [Patescibacteria group bacterium]